MGFRALLLCLPFLAPLAGAQESAPVLLEPGADDGVLVGEDNVRYLLPDGELHWQQVAGMPGDAWSRPRSNAVAAPPGNDSVWLHVPVANAGARAGDWRLEIRSIRLRSLAVYQVADGRLEAGHLLGSDHPAPPEQRRAVLALPVHLEAGARSDLYLEIRDPITSYAPLMFWSSNAFARYGDLRLAFFSMVVAIVLAMTLYNASLYLFTRDRNYFFYSNSVASTGLYVLAISGYGQQYLWPGVTWLENHAFSVFSSYCFLSVTCFFRAFLDLRRHGGWVLHANTVFLGVWALIGLAAVTGHYDSVVTLAGLAGLGVTVTGLATAIYLWFKRSRAAMFFCIAWTPLSIATFVTIAVLIGAVNYFPAIAYLQPVGFTIEVVLLSIALADRINRDREAREQAQALALERQTALLELREQANVELEARVRARTGELREALVELEHANGELARLSTTDPLTRVHNRRHFDDVGTRQVENSARLGQPLSVLVVDLDHFKDINDTHGHAAGDRCLCLAAEAIAATASRPGDLVARIGGEEFAVILPNTDVESGARVGERVRRAIQDISMVYAGTTVKVTTSVGVAGWTMRSGDTLGDLTHAADTALYQAKEDGRNRVVVAPPRTLRAAR